MASAVISGQILSYPSADALIPRLMSLFDRSSHAFDNNFN